MLLTHLLNNPATTGVISSPSSRCCFASRCTPSISLTVVTLPASQNAHPSASATTRNASAIPRPRTSAPANFSTIVPLGVAVGGGDTIKIGGTGIPGSIGARRIAFTTAVTPWAADHALLNGYQHCISFVPKHSTTRSSGELISITCSTPCSPFRPGFSGSSHTVRRPFRQFSITRTGSPPATSPRSITPGQRSSNGSRRRSPGTIPQLNESPYTRTLNIILSP